ncbi:MAG: copper transporter [Bifidobacteriaceae bacterium]|jgi:hypothetical protein|nr:copper transporter [Bifidobacteriaceae bacterium]
MINFRYHVVSLVAVFTALAVGILLGAGPLKEPIETSLADQVSSLREDKLTLRDQLEAAANRGDYADQAFRELLPEAAAGLLAGRGVAVVAIGEQSETRLDDIKDGLGAAGAELAADIQLDDAWESGTDESRAEVAAAVADLLGESAGESLGDRAMIAVALATALRDSGGEDPAAGGTDPSRQPGDDPSDPGASGEPGASGGSQGSEESSGGTGATGAETAAELWVALAEAGIASGTLVGPVGAVVVVAGPYIEDPAKIDPDADTTGRREAFVGVVAALADAGLKTVVAGPDQTRTDLVARLRADESLETAVSTVAAPIPAAEAVTVIRALAAGFHAIFGAYGMSGGSADMPPHRPAPVTEPDDPDDGAAQGGGEAEDGRQAAGQDVDDGREDNAAGGGLVQGDQPAGTVALTAWWRTNAIGGGQAAAQAPAGPAQSAGTGL